MKNLILLLILSVSINSYANSDWFSAKRVATPKKTGSLTATVSTKSGGNSEYNEIFSGLQSLKESGSVSCNQSYNTSAHALICNCANEAGNQSLDGMTAVSRVVFSRAKSPHYPTSIKGVVCQRYQFSWTIGGWNSNCRRTKGNPTYFNSKYVKGSTLAKCAVSAQTAARKELVEKPTKLYALNYCSTNPKAYRNAIPRWCRTLINTTTPLGGHVFGFAEGGQQRSVPPRGSSSSSISFFNLFRNLNLFVSTAFAGEGERLRIVNTKATHKLFYDDKIKEILNKKYKDFSAYTFKDYKKSVQDLMVETRNNLPGATIADYNGDGKSDLILMGSNRKKHIIIAFLSSGRGYNDYVVSSEPGYKKPLEIYLVNIQKSKILFNDKKSRDAFQIESFGGAAIAKFFDGRKFVDNNSKNGFKFE